MDCRIALQSASAVRMGGFTLPTALVALLLLAAVVRASNRQLQVGTAATSGHIPGFLALPAAHPALEPPMGDPLVHNRHECIQ